MEDVSAVSPLDGGWGVPDLTSELDETTRWMGTSRPPPSLWGRYSVPTSSIPLPDSCPLSLSFDPKFPFSIPLRLFLPCLSFLYPLFGPLSFISFGIGPQSPPSPPESLTTCLIITPSRSRLALPGPPLDLFGRVGTGPLGRSIRPRRPLPSRPLPRRESQCDLLITRNRINIVSFDSEG